MSKQIIDLGEAARACRLCRYEGAKTFLCDACFEAGHSDNPHGLAERRALLAERAAVVKYLRERAKGTRDWGTNELIEIEDWISDIEEGAHVP